MKSNALSICLVVKKFSAVVVSITKSCTMNNTIHAPKNTAAGELVTCVSNLEYRICLCIHWTENRRATRNQHDNLNMVCLYDSLLFELICLYNTNTIYILAFHKSIQILIVINIYLVYRPKI